MYRKGDVVMTNVADDAVLGRFARQQHDLFRRVREGSLDPGLVARAIQNIMELKDPTLESVEEIRLSCEIPIVVNYAEDIASLLLKSGVGISETATGIKEGLFPSRRTKLGSCLCRARLFSPGGRKWRNAEMLYLMRQSLFSPASIEDLLAYGFAMRPPNFSFAVVALGSSETLKGRSVVARLQSVGYVSGPASWSLETCWDGGDWPSDNRPLGVQFMTTSLPDQ